MCIVQSLVRYSQEMGFFLLQISQMKTLRPKEVALVVQGQG